MSYIDTYRRLAGRNLHEAMASDEGLIKKFAKKTKIGSYDIRAVHSALDTIDPGWKLELLAAPMRVKEGMFNPVVTDAVRNSFMHAHRLYQANFGTYESGSRSKDDQFDFSLYYGPKASERGGLYWNEEPTKAQLDSLIAAFRDTLLSGIIESKTVPEDAPQGQRFVNPVGKPEVRNRPFRFWGEPKDVEGVFEITVIFEVSNLREVVEVQRLTSPDGKSIDLEGASASLWTFLYKTGIEKKAQDYIDREGIAAKDAAKKAMKGYSANDVIGTCGICRQIQKLRHQTLVLHGYQRPGYGWIQGSCFGVHFKAWELSPESVEAYIKHLDKAIPRQKEAISNLKAAKQFTVFIDDKFLVKGSGQGSRKYILTKDSFTLEDGKKYSSDEVKRSGITKLYDVYALDAKHAERAFDAIKNAQVERAEKTYAQLVEIRKESVQAVANWKPQKLPGGATEEVRTMQKLAGIREWRWYRRGT